MIAAAARPAGWFAAPGGGGGNGLRRAGFTLLEILLALALLALLVGATVSISADLAGSKSVTAEDQFWKALTEARKEALTLEKQTTLKFDDQTKAFVVENDSGTRSFPVTVGTGKLTVDFLPSQSTNNVMLLGGDVVETKGMPYVTFYPDGTCTPFRIQFRHGGPAHVIGIDPWTCAEVLETKE